MTPTDKTGPAMTEDEIVEIGAKALAHAANPKQNWDYRPRHEQEFYRIEFREALAALHAAGLVPAPPTDSKGAA